MKYFSEEQIGILTIVEYDARELYLTSGKARVGCSDYIKEDLLERINNLKLSVEEFTSSLELQENE